MIYLVIGIILGILIGTGIAICIKQNKLKSENKVVITENQTYEIEESQQDKFAIVPEKITIEDIGDESKLIEINDLLTLTSINKLIPELAQVGNAINNVVQSANSSGDILYRAILPAGAKLTDSKAMNGAVRGIYHGADGIKGHVNLVEVNQSSTVITNTAAAAIGIASMVVGQYYMNQINGQLSEINDGLSQIQNFQNAEYNGKVFFIYATVKEITDYKAEILVNDELRLKKLSVLEKLSNDCSVLLGQANEMLKQFSNGNCKNYEKYEKTINDTNGWFMYQKLLLEMLYKISDLKYTLYLGNASREHCTALLSTYMDNVNEVQTSLASWHENMTKKFKVDIEEARRKRKGIDGAIHRVPGLVNNKHNYRSINEKTISLIENQSSGHDIARYIDNSELYSEEVQLISKNGKLYYLPKND